MAAVSTGQIRRGGGQHHQLQAVNAFSQWSKNKNEIPRLSYSQQAKRDSMGYEGDAMPDCYPYKQFDEQGDRQDSDKLKSTFSNSSTNAQGQCF